MRESQPKVSDGMWFGGGGGGGGEGGRMEK